VRLYRAIGDFIGRNTRVLCPVAVFLAVLLPQPFQPFKVAVPAMFAFMTFQGSLDNTFERLADAFRHPLPLVVTVVLASFVVPLVTYPVARALFGFDQDLLCGLALQPCVPIGISCAIWVSLFGGDVSLALATLMVSTVISPFSIPLMLQHLLGQSVEVDVLSMMKDLALMVALPALFGTALNTWSGGWASERLDPVIEPASRVMFLLVIACNSSGLASYVRNLSPALVAVIGYVVAMTVLGFALGFLVAHVLHLSDEQAVTAVFCCGLRNISSGAVLAAMYFSGAAIFPVICGTLVQQSLAGLAGSLVERYLAARSAANEGAGDAPGPDAAAGSDNAADPEGATDPDGAADPEGAADPDA